MKTGIGYKLFEMNPEGKLFPLFIGKTKETELNKWLHAEYLPTKGFACRGGWHIGTIPSAPWLMSADRTYKSQRSKYWKRVWCEVEYNTNHNYDKEVNLLPKKCFVDKCPEDGFYFFKDCDHYPETMEEILKYGRTTLQDNRCEGINIECYDEKIDKLEYPLKLVSSSYKGTYEDCKGRSYPDPNQGFFKGYWSGSDYEKYYNKIREAENN